MSNSDPIRADEVTHPPTTAPIPEKTINQTTKSDLLSRARKAVDAGEQSLHEAAESLGLAKEDHSASQREMAEAVGKSASWVNKLLKWRASGYKDHSPFGPTTKNARVEHAQRRSTSREAVIEPSAEADDPEISAQRRKAEYARREAEENTVSTDLEPSISPKPSPAVAKRNIIAAIDQNWSHLNAAGKKDVSDYFQKMADEPA